MNNNVTEAERGWKEGKREEGKCGKGGGGGGAVYKTG